MNDEGAIRLIVDRARTGSGIIMINFLPMCEKGLVTIFTQRAERCFSLVSLKRRCVTAIDHFVRRNTYLTVVKCTRPRSYPEN